MLKEALKRNKTATANADALAVLRENFAGCFTKDGAFDLKTFAARIRDNSSASLIRASSFFAGMYADSAMILSQTRVSESSFMAILSLWMKSLRDSDSAASA